MDEIQKFNEEKRKNIQKLRSHKSLKKLANKFIKETIPYKYSYNFTWLGRPIIQFPQDIVMMQELIWEIQPDLIIETGIAYGGSLVLYASILELIGKGEVIGIDIDIRKHNRKAIENHPLSRRMTMLEGSSTDAEVIKKVKKMIHNKQKVLVCLDSNHTREHVLKELEIYSPFISKGSYLVVSDSTLEEMPEKLFRNRPWKKGNSPFTAVKAFLKKNKNFRTDKMIDGKLLITSTRGGYLKRIR